MQYHASAFGKRIMRSAKEKKVIYEITSKPKTHLGKL